jgi:hypothetical protein
MVHRNTIKPGLHTGLVPETRKVFERLDEDLLSQIHGVIAIVHESIADTINQPLISNHEFVESRHVAGQIPLDDAVIRLRIL